MSYLDLSVTGTSEGFGCCCEQGMGQASDPVTGVFNLLDSIVGAGAKFIPETKEMRRRREAQEALERDRLQAEQIQAALTSKTALGLGALVVLGLGAYLVFGRKKRR